MSDKTDFYVYMYFRPNGIPCYVGKGRGRRWQSHLKHTQNQHLASIIKKAGGEIPYAKVRENLTNAQAIMIEIALIAAIGRNVHGGTLVNMTDGGDGGTGRNSPQFSPESRERLRLARLGKKASLATRQKQRERALSNRSQPPSRKGAISEKRGTRLSVEQCAKISASLLRFNANK